MTQQHHVGVDFKWNWFAQGGLYLFVFVCGHLLYRILNSWMPGLPILLNVFIVGIGVLCALVCMVLMAWLLAQWLWGPLRRMGLGWHLSRLADKRDFVWHNGATGGYRSYMAVAPAERVGVVVLSNCNRSVDALGVKALEAVRRAEAGAKSS